MESLFYFGEYLNAKCAVLLEAIGLRWKGVILEDEIVGMIGTLG
jgi:hypothetical protein